MRLRTAGFALLSSVIASSAWGQSTFEGQLAVNRAGKGRVERSFSTANFGFGSFTLRNLEIKPSVNSDGLFPDQETVWVQVGNELYGIAPGDFRGSKNGKRFKFRDTSVQSGVRSMTMVRTSYGSYRVNLTIVGLNLTAVVVADPSRLPLCAWLEIRVGNDDALTAVRFDLPKPEPSKLLTLPGICDLDDVSQEW